DDFAGCAVIISHDRFFLDRLCTHILAFEGDAHVEWFEGNFEAYEEDKVRRLGPDSIAPKRVKYKKFTRRGGDPCRFRKRNHCLCSVVYPLLGHLEADLPS